VNNALYIKCDVTNNMDVPNSENEIATAPLVLNAVPGLTEKEPSSGIEQNQIRSRRMKMAKCRVPTTAERSKMCDGRSVSCRFTSHSKRSEQDSCVPKAMMSGTWSIPSGKTNAFICLGGVCPFIFQVPIKIVTLRDGRTLSNSKAPNREIVPRRPCKKFRWRALFAGIRCSTWAAISACQAKLSVLAGRFTLVSPYTIICS
jgi:hypothetical protein